MTEAGAVGHRNYVLGKLGKEIAQSAARIAAIRAPLDWEREVEKWDHHGALHDMMLHGYQHDKGRTPEKGWRHEYGRSTSEGPRRHDDALVKQSPFGHQVVEHTVETKAGGVRIDDGLKQLRKERELLSSGRTQTSEYVIRALRPPHPEVMKAARQLAKDFPGRFQLVELDEPEFQRVVELGRPIVQQREMTKLGHLVGKLRRSPELRTAPRAVRGFLREVSRAKRQGRPIGLEVLVGARVELAAMLEVDSDTTQRMDKIAREAAGLQLKEARIVEAVQAKQRQTRAARLSQLIGRVDREIVMAAAAAAIEQVPDLGKARAAQLRDMVRGDRTIEQTPEMERRVEAMVQAAVRQADADRANKAREVLGQMVLPTPTHHAVADLVLDQQRQTGEPPTVKSIREAERTVRERQAETQKRQREQQQREAREKQQREMMDRVADAYNRTLEAAAREHGARGGSNQVEARHVEKQAEQLAKDLAMDPAKLVAKGIDPHAVDAIARGDARLDRGSDAYVVEVEGRTVYVGLDSEEAGLARRIQQVETGMDLQKVQALSFIEKGMPTVPAALSREQLAEKRAELERQRQRERERGVQGRTAADRERDGKERGMERGR
ncbi:hypothetical protein [Nocardia asteroides]|uniref:hypothetical protein n=1 Tax=Nocardia asteroides TaxID=1824 RepID=UPI0033DF4B83